MSFLSNLQNSINTSSIGGSAQLFLSTGNANNNIETHAKNAMMINGCGNNNIAVDVSQDLVIDTGCCGQDRIIGNAGNAFINTHESDDMVVLDCDNLDLDIGNGNDNVLVSARGTFNINGGFGDKTIVAESLNQTYGNNFITLKDGNHTINAMGNNIGIATGNTVGVNGFQTIGTVGNNHRIVTGHGNHNIGFYGDNIGVSLGNGNNDIRTTDNWITANAQGFMNVYDSAMGMFDHNVGLASTLEMNTAVFKNNVVLGYDFSGVTNVNIDTGFGTTQGLLTIGNGAVNFKSASNQKLEILTGENGSLQNFQAGIFRGQNGYIVPNTAIYKTT